MSDPAQEVCCARCGERIADSRSLIGTVMVSYYTPATGHRNRIILCGSCGLSFREFICPSVVGDAGFQQAAAELRGAW